jgi:hypothetical protein
MQLRVDVRRKSCHIGLRELVERKIKLATQRNTIPYVSFSTVPQNGTVMFDSFYSLKALLYVLWSLAGFEI